VKAIEKTDFERRLAIVQLIKEINDKRCAEIIKLRKHVETYDFAIFDPR